MSKIRLQKYLADCGVASRRASEKLIAAGKVQVNKVVVREMGVMVDPEKDRVCVGGSHVQPEEDRVYYMLNKPAGYVTTAFDPMGRKKVIDLVPRSPRVFSIGRLDKDTTGMLLLTNDGAFANFLTHPKYEKEKEYCVKAQMIESKFQIEDVLNKFKNGIELREGLAKADSAVIIEKSSDTVTFSLVLHQGWKRQIRRMCEAVGLTVIELMRTKIGTLTLGDLAEGSYRMLTEDEVDGLRA